MTIRQVEKGQAALLDIWPTQGPPSAATVEIRTSANAELLAAAAATVDDVEGTIAAASARDKTLTIVVTQGSISAGENYWIRDAGGREWPIEIVAYEGTTAKLAEPMRHDITGGTLLGGRMTYSLASSLTGTLGRDNRVIWRYTTGGRARMEQYLLDVVNWPFALPVTIADIRGVVPHWSDTSDSFDGLREHVERELFERVADMKVLPDLVFDRQHLLTAAIYRILQLRYAAEPETAAEWKSHYDAAFGYFVSSRKWYDSDEDAAKAYATGTGLVTVSDGGYAVRDEYGENVVGGEDFMPPKYMPIG